jgi:hypothetical protein
MPGTEAFRSAAVLNDVSLRSDPQLSTKLSTASVNIGFLPVVPSGTLFDYAGHTTRTAPDSGYFVVRSLGRAPTSRRVIMQPESRAACVGSNGNLQRAKKLHRYGFNP